MLFLCFDRLDSIIRNRITVRIIGDIGMNTEKLIKNIIDQIKEAQIKLGFAKETTRLYYPVESLNGMLGCRAEDDIQMLAILEGAGLENGELGLLRFSAHKGRIEISVPPEGAVYVHEQVGEPAFLKAMIELFRQDHHCRISDIRNLFESFSKDYVCEKMPEGSDFDEVFYFKDALIDPYYYCVKEEMGHTIYHRFTKEDMANLW